MSQLTIARRYARALLEQAEAEGVTDPVDADVRAIRDAVAASRELAAFLESPILSRERKQSVVRALFAGRVEDVTLRFLEMLADKRREGLFAMIADAYLEQRDEQLGVVGVSVRTARTLDAAAEKAIARRIGEITGKESRLDVAVDASLMGGLVVRVGDTVYDGSVLNRLESLRERLIHGTAANA